MPPISVMKIETTIAKIGRSMKKWERFIGERDSVGLRLEVDLSWLRRDLGTRPRAHEPVDHDSIVRLEAGADDAEIVVGGPGAHHLRLDRAVVEHRHHDLARLVRDHGRV